MAKLDPRLVRIVALLLLLHVVNLHLDAHGAELAFRVGGLPGLLAALFLVGWHERVRRQAIRPSPPPRGAKGFIALLDPVGAACLLFSAAGFGAAPVTAAARTDRGALARGAFAGLAALLLAALVPAALAALARALGAPAAACAPLDALGATSLRLLALQMLPLPPLDGALLLAAAAPALARAYDRAAPAGPWILFCLAAYGTLDRLLDALTPPGIPAPAHLPSPVDGTALAPPPPEVAA